MEKKHHKIQSFIKAINMPKQTTVSLDYSEKLNAP